MAGTAVPATSLTGAGAHPEIHPSTHPGTSVLTQKAVQENGMIIDQLTVFFDGEAASGGAAVSPSFVFMPRSGEGSEPVNVTVALTGAGSGPASLAVTVQESADGESFADLGVFTLKKPGQHGEGMTFALPRAAQERHIRLAYALTGTAAGLRVFAGVTRDRFAPARPALAMRKGKAAA